MTFWTSHVTVYLVSVGRASGTLPAGHCNTWFGGPFFIESPAPMCYTVCACNIASFAGVRIARQIGNDNISFFRGS